MAKTGYLKEALLLLSSARRFNTQRRHILLKYGLYKALTPETYFNELSKLCVLSHMKFPMKFLMKSNFTDKLHEFVFHRGKPSSAGKVKSLNKLLCTWPLDVAETVNHISTLTSRFSCDTDHSKQEHRQHMIMRIFAHAVALDNYEFAQKLANLLNPSSGLLLSYYCDSLDYAHKFPEDHIALVNIIRSVDNFEEHRQAFGRIFNLSVTSFRRVHEQAKEDDILNSKGRVMFFLNALFCFFAEHREYDLRKTFDRYASSYINPNPPTPVQIDHSMRIAFVLFMAVMRGLFGQPFVDWLRENNFVVDQE